MTKVFCMRPAVPAPNWVSLMCQARVPRAELFLIRHSWTRRTTRFLYSPGAMEISNNTGEASPLTELKNGTTDRLFVGITKGDNNAGLCRFNGGCVENFDITLLMPTTTASASVSEAGGTSGIVVDNVSTAPEASSIYFGPLTANLIVK